MGLLLTSGLGESDCASLFSLIFGTGELSVTVTVTDADGYNLPYATVQVWRSDWTPPPLVYQLTSISGQVVFQLDAGAYNVRISKSGYSFADAAMNVSSPDGLSHTFAAASVTLPPPSGASLCSVYFDIGDDVGGTDFTDTPYFEARYIETPHYHGTRSVRTNQPISHTYDAVLRRVVWDCPQGATVRFRVPDHGIDKTAVIPAQASIWLKVI